ncbi:MAG: amidohydrolase family protein [Deltaproteobacteria bacterium]
MRYDLVISGGIVVDGTGLARRRGDVAIKDGRIMAVGHVVDAADTKQTMDATGRIVAPGIIDAHTHYDPQLTFDPWATSSCYHGVTTIIAGNCGFSLAPAKPEARPYLARMFAKVEGMAPEALAGVKWDFETFPEFLEARRGKLGVNLACYIGHSSLRRYVMGADGSEREATPDEVAEMQRLVREAMAAGAAGFSSSHAPTQVDGEDRPIPSRFSSLDELKALVAATGESGGGSISYLPRSVVGGLNHADEDLLIELALLSRLPIVIQGLGGRDKVDVPGAGWEEALVFLERASEQGAAIFSLMRNNPFDRPIDFERGSTLYGAVPSWNALMALGHDAKIARLNDPAVRTEMRHAVENPNRDEDKGSTMPPPKFEVTIVDEVTRPENEKYLRRTISEIAAEMGKEPADAMLDLALSEDLQMKFRWEDRSDRWEAAVKESMKHPAILMGVSDGGAHLDRDDGADWSTYFLSHWVREKKEWTLEEGIRQLTQVPAAMAGITDRGMVQPGLAADLMIFDEKMIGAGTKRMVHDLPGGAGRFQARPEGIFATIVNGEAIVIDGELTKALPGQLVRPSGTTIN